MIMSARKVIKELKYGRDNGNENSLKDPRITEACNNSRCLYQEKRTASEIRTLNG
jgi:hypothetical protein